MKKRLIALVMAIAMVMSISSYPIAAVAETGSEVSIALDPSSHAALAIGDEVTVNVKIFPNSGVNSITSVILFDTDRLEFVPFSKNKDYKGDAEPGETFTFNDENAASGKIVIISTSAEEFSESGTYYKLKFKVKSTAKNGRAAFALKLGTEGNDCTQYAKDGKIYYLTNNNISNLELTVSVPVTGITISGEDSIVGIGKTTQLSVAAEPSNAAQPSEDMSDVEWTSSDTSVATVANGLVTSVAEGKTTITAKFADKTAAKEITVSRKNITDVATANLTGYAIYDEPLLAWSNELVSRRIPYTVTWYREGSDTDTLIKSENSVTAPSTYYYYYLTKEDIGHRIYAVITADEYAGSLTSEYSDTVVKATQAAPTVEIVAEENKIKVVNPDEKAQYRLTGGEFGTATEFNVNYDTEYTVDAYYPETDTHKASEVATSNAVTTPKAPRGFSVVIEGNGTVEGTPEGKVREGEEVTLTATPDSTVGSESKFVGWEAEGVTIDDASANPLTVTLGSEDVKITAKFELKPEVQFEYENVEFVYDGTSKTPTCDALDTTVTKTVEYYDSLNNKLTGVPENAGSYKMKVTFTGDAYRTTTAEIEFNIRKAPRTPVTPQIDDSSVTSGSFGFVDGTLYGEQRYAINTTGATPDETDWVDPIALKEQVASGLEPNTTYYVFTCLPEETNYAMTIADSVSVTTKHTYSWEIVSITSSHMCHRTDNGADVRIRKGAVPQPIVVTIKNTGTGEINLGGYSTNPTYIGQSSSYVKLSLNKSTVASGETVTMTFTPRPERLLTTDSTMAYTVGAELRGTNLSMQVIITIKIIEKNAVDFSGIESSTTVEFNGRAQGIDLSNISVKHSGYDYVIYDSTKGSASNLTVTYFDKDGAAVAEPRNAGTYTATIAYEDDDYVGSTTAKLIIEPKEVTVALDTDTTATKEYDGNTKATVDTSSLKLDGAIEGTDVKIAEGDLNWNYDTKNAGENKTVTNKTAIALDGADKDNYTLTNTAIELKGTIEKKALTVTATVADKTYNGLTNDAAVTTSITGLVEGDDVKLENIVGTYESADAGDAVKVSVVYTVSGEDKDNYSFNTAAEATGKINKAELTVAFTAMAGVTYDGKEHPAVYTASGIVASDSAKNLFNVTYNGSTEAPVDAGTYSVTAALTEEGSKNYTLATAGAFGLVISNAKLTATPAVYTFAYTLTGKQTRALSELQLTPAVAGTWSVDETIAPTGNTALLTSYAVEGENFAFTLANNKASNVGNEEVITLKFTPAKNYDSVTVTVTIRIAADTYTNSIAPALPATVKLGDALDLSGVKLVTKFGSGAADQQLDVTDSAKVKVENTYDPTATGSGAVGSKTVKFTDVENSDITYTHSFTVVDVLDGTALETSESEVSYTLGTDKLSDFNMFAKYKSGETKALTNADVKLTFEEGMTEQRMLNTIGSHKVTAAYTEKYFDGSETTQSYTFTVVVSSTAASVDGTPNAEGFTLTPVPDKDKEMTYSNSRGDIPAADVTGTLGAADDAGKSALQQEEDKNASFKTIGDNKVYEQIVFTDTNDLSAEFKDGKMQVTVPYPADSTKDKTFVIILRNADGTTETIAPTKTETGLQFTITGDTQFVIGWYDAEPEDTESEAEDSYWTEVYWALINSRNSTVTANAGYYDKVPQGVLRAVDISGNTLVINSAYGMQVVITPNAIEKAGSYRIYYPISYLNQVFGGSSAVISGTATATATGVTVGVLMPTTGDDTVVNGVYTMTPATAGYMVGMESVDNAKAVIDSADGVSVLEGAQLNDGAVIGGWMLIGLGLLALVGAAYIAMRKREN